ncbi:S1 RNA-binding domain-containing protein [bacterium]|nr:S1 RNA-binding domain-containing protein [candidate division CSSED10-310 bacterium]
MNKDKNKIEWDDSMDMTMEEFDQAISGSMISEEVRPGEKVTGIVIAISESSVFIDINAKSEGIIALEEFVDPEGALTVKRGDTITATVTHVGDEIQLSYKMRKRDQSIDMLREAYAGRIPVEGRVESLNKGGFEVSLGDKKAFCPISQIDIDFVEDPNKYMGANYHFYITQIDPKGRNIVVSRAQYLKEERQKEAEITMTRLAVGAIVTGEVRRVADFGVFVDLGGVDGLVHISQLSWDRVTHPSQLVSVGQTVHVKVIQIDPETNRIGLSMREAEENPWDIHVGTDIIEGNSYLGEVMRVENFGAFVRLKPGLEGLVHLSELRWGQRVNHPSEVMKTGDQVLVKVIGIDQEKHRLSLSLKQIEEDPWTLLAPSLTTGTVLSGTITAVKPNGLEVKIDNGPLGFIPGSKTGVGQGENIRTSFKDGQTIQTRVVEADPDTRRLILEVVDLDAEQQKLDVRQYLTETGTETSTGFGSLGSKLQKAMEKKQRKP